MIGVAVLSKIMAMLEDLNCNGITKWKNYYSLSFRISMIGKAVLDKIMAMSEESNYKWVVVVAAFFTQFIVCGITYSIGVFQIVFQTIFDHDHFDTSWVGSILLYTTALTSKLDFSDYIQTDQ